MPLQELFDLYQRLLYFQLANQQIPFAIVTGKHKVFFQVLVWTIIANIVAGAKVHWDNHTFKLKTLLWKNIEMCIIILFTYPILEGINRITGDNLAGDVFQWAIQIGTILYPGSKAIKNLHIWSNGKYPPAFIMEKIYKFEKDGDVKDLLNKE